MRVKRTGHRVRSAWSAWLRPRAETLAMPIERTIPTLRGRLEGTVTAPPSKSVTQRALLVAALGGGRSIVRNLLLADDSRHLINALGAVGIRTALEGAAEHPVVEVEGRGGTFPAASAEISVGNAGTAMRFLTAALAAGGGTYVIDGNARMRERPIEDLLAALRALGASASSVRGDGCPPVRVGGRGLQGG